MKGSTHKETGLTTFSMRFIVLIKELRTFYFVHILFSIFNQSFLFVQLVCFALLHSVREVIQLFPKSSALSFIVLKI